MSNDEIIMLVGGAIAIILGAIDVLRTSVPGAISLTSVGVIVLGAVFVLLALV